MKFLALVIPLVALVAGSHPHAPVLIPYVVNPGGIGGIYKGPDSATIIKGPDGAVIKSKQIGGSVAIDDVHGHGHGHGYGHGGHAGIIHAGGASAGAIHAGPVSAGAIHAAAASAGHIHAGGASAGAIHAGPVSAGSIHAGPLSAGSIHAGPVSSGAIIADSVHSGYVHHGLDDGLLHTGLGAVANIDYSGLDIGHVATGGVSAGSIHAGPVSAGSLSVGPSSAGSIHAGPSSAGSIHVAPSSAGSIHAAPVSAGSIHVAPSSAGSIHAGPSSAGSIHVGSSGPGLIHTVHDDIPTLVHSGPSVVLTKNPIIVPDVVVATHDPKIVVEDVIVGNKVISVPKKVEEDTDLIGPSGTISTRGGDAVISGPSSTTIKGGGVVTDVKKQEDLHLKTVEVKPLLGAAVVSTVPAVHPVVESAGTIITHARPILPAKGVYAASAPVLPLHPIVSPISSHGPVLAHPLPLGLSGFNELPHYAPAYVKHPHY